MPTNKLWIEHTERAAWDSVEALRERLLKAEGRLQALANGVERMPQLLDLLDDAKRKLAPDAQGYDEVVAQLLARLEQLQAQVGASAVKAPEPTRVSIALPPARPRLDSDELDERARGADDDELDLESFAHTMQRHGGGDEVSRDLNRLLTLAENKLDDLSELEGAALREAAVELAVLAARIYGASRSGR